MSSPPRRAFVLGLALAPFAVVARSGAAQAPAIPAHNRADLRTPPPRPPAGDVEERLRLLVDAITRDAPEVAHDLFLPRDAFRLIKAVDAPDPLFDRLLGAFDRDVHALAAAHRGHALRYEGFRFTTRRAFVGVREEANRLPYWAQRHSWLTVRDDARAHEIEIRTMITWDDRWYVTHLSEFHQAR